MVRDKVRIRFRKFGDLRLVSHHDLMRCFERMLRRSELPFRSSAGFNPKPRLVFALSLALGVVGCQEVVELELDAEVSPEEVKERLARQAPPGLEILEARRIDPKENAHVRRICYRLAVPSQRLADVPAHAAALLQAPQIFVDRSRPQPRRIDVRPYIHELRVRDDALEIDLWVKPTGCARPEEIVHLLGLADLLDAGAVLERAHLELTDEVERN